MNMEEIKHQLIKHEALRLKPYKDTVGKLTIGVGRNIDDKGITAEEAMFLLENDIKECIEDLKNIFQGYDDLNEPRQRALIDMRFNLGPARFRQFKKMIAAVNEKDFNKAADEMMNSKWYNQVGQRAKSLIEMIKKE